MGTRGFIAFVIDGREKTSYVHAAAYPEHLGVTVLRWVRDAAVNQAGIVEARARALRTVDPESRPDPADAVRLARYAEPRGGDPASWYALLRGTMGNPALILEAGAVADAADWPRHPQARWGYVIDLDARAFEAYRGGQAERHGRGRFARREPFHAGGMTFWPAALAASWPFRALPRDEAFTDACYAGAGGGG